MLDCCEKQGFSYTLGLRTNARLKRIAEPLMDKAVCRCERTGRKQRLFMRFLYQADSWPHSRTVVAKAECHADGTNLRFVVTNLDVRKSKLIVWFLIGILFNDYCPMPARSLCAGRAGWGKPPDVRGHVPDTLWTPFGHPLDTT